MKKKIKKKQLDPIGMGSYANEHGYDLGLLVSWLESIRDSEVEKAMDNPNYCERADAFSDAVDKISEFVEEE